MPRGHTLLYEEEAAVEDAAEYVARLELRQIKELMAIVKFPDRRVHDTHLKDWFELSLPRQSLVVRQQTIAQVKHHRSLGLWSQCPLVLAETPAPETPIRIRNTRPLPQTAWRSGLHDALPQKTVAPQVVVDPAIDQSVEWSNASIISEEDVTRPSPRAAYDLGVLQNTVYPALSDIVDLTLENQEGDHDFASATFPNARQRDPVLNEALDDVQSSSPYFDTPDCVDDFDNDSVRDCISTAETHKLAENTEESNTPLWPKRRRIATAPSDVDEDNDTLFTPSRLTKRTKCGCADLQKPRSASEEACIVDMTAASVIDSGSDDDLGDGESDDDTCQSGDHNAETVNGTVDITRTTGRRNPSYTVGLKQSDEFLMTMPEASEAPEAHRAAGPAQQPTQRSISRASSFSITSSLRDSEEQGLDPPFRSSPTPILFDSSGEANASLHDSGDSIQPQVVDSPGPERAQTPQNIQNSTEGGLISATIAPSALMSPACIGTDGDVQLPTPPNTQTRGSPPNTESRGSRLVLTGRRGGFRGRELSLQDILAQTCSTRTTQHQRTTVRNERRELGYEDIFGPSVTPQTPLNKAASTVPTPQVIDLASDDDVADPASQCPSSLTSFNASSPSHPALHGDISTERVETLTTTKTRTTTRHSRTLTADDELQIHYWNMAFNANIVRFTENSKRLFSHVRTVKETQDTQAGQIEDLQRQNKTLEREMETLKTALRAAGVRARL